MFAENSLASLAPKKTYIPKAKVQEQVPTDVFLKACETGHVSLIKRTIGDSNLLVLVSTSAGTTGLSLACKNGHFEIAKILLKAGADIECCDAHNHTPVHYSIIGGHHKILNLLIKNGADINSFDKTDSFTPLMLAIMHRDYFSLHALLDKVDLRVKNHKREDIYDYVLTEKHITSNVKYIFSSHLNTRDEYKKREQIYNILLSKSERISEMTTRQMLEFLASNKLEKQDVYHFVFHKRHETMLNNIITKTSFTKDLKIIPKGYDREYPFFLLCVKENLCTVVKSLIEKGVNINAPLEAFEESKILKLFSKEEIGQSALMIAYKERHIEMVDLLLEYGADINYKDKNNWSVIDFAKEKKDRPMVEKFKLFAD